MQIGLLLFRFHVFTLFNIDSLALTLLPSNTLASLIIDTNHRIFRIPAIQTTISPCKHRKHSAYINEQRMQPSMHSPIFYTQAIRPPTTNVPAERRWRSMQYTAKFNNDTHSFHFFFLYNWNWYFRFFKNQLVNIISSHFITSNFMLQALIVCGWKYVE